MESGEVRLNGSDYDTINYIGSLSANLNVFGMATLEDAPFRNVSDKSADGFEDLRTFFWKEDLWCLASARRNADDTNTMALLKISGNRIAESYLLESPLGASREKNWMPFVSDGKLHAIHTMNPLTIVEINEHGATVSLRKTLKVPKDLLGSSQLVRWKDGWLCVVHERSRGKKRLYKHRFVYFDPGWEAMLSEPFYWKEYGVEFCCGLAVHDGIVAVGFGVNDSEAIIAQFNEIDIDRLLEWGWGWNLWPPFAGCISMLIEGLRHPASPWRIRRRPDLPCSQTLAGLLVRVASGKVRKCAIRWIDLRAVHHNAERVVSTIEHLVHHRLDVVSLSRLIVLAEFGA
ncbi:hypothetical protein PQR02_33460, partial [Paraburkholderia sediminicola]